MEPQYGPFRPLDHYAYAVYYLQLHPGNRLVIPLIRNGLTIGRNPSQGLCLPHPSVCPLHATVVFDLEAQQFTLVNHSVVNGTILNGQRIDKARLTSTAVLQFGDYRLTVDMADRTSRPLEIRELWAIAQRGTGAGLQLPPPIVHARNY